MPLLYANKGEQVVLKEVNFSTKLKKKLHDMGLTPGVKFSVISSGGRGPVIIDVRGTRLALGRGIVSNLVVDSI